MSQYLLPAVFTIFVWWFSTGVILFLGRLPRWTFRWTMLKATLVLGFALVGMAISASRTSVASAYCAFTCAVLVWAWQEIGFLLGFVTGSRKTECPKGARGWRKFGFAAETVSYHEIALVVLGAAVWLVSQGAPNQVGLWTYLVLWAMRQSAKLNVYFGVRNLNESFLPAHLKYLQTYFTRKAMNAFLPVSVVLSSLIVVPIWQAVGAAGIGGFEVVALTITASLLSLAILEHFFLVVPLPFELLWKWGLRSRVASQSPR